MKYKENVKKTSEIIKEIIKKKGMISSNLPENLIFNEKNNIN